MSLDNTWMLNMNVAPNLSLSPILIKGSKEEISVIVIQLKPMW